MSPFRKTPAKLLILFAAAALPNPYLFAGSGDDLFEMSLEDLLDIRIEVASSRGNVIFDTPSTVSVIDRETIEKYSFKSITEALLTVSGFSVKRTYLKRNLPTSRGILQDHYANKVLVMINNIPTWHAGTGEANIDRVDINDVERIEILKGPASVLFGTNAYSGAVNIILRNVEDDCSCMVAETGAGHYIKGGARSGFSQGDLSVSISAHACDETGRHAAWTDETGEHGHMYEYIDGSTFNINGGFRNHLVLLNAYSSHESYLGVSQKYSTGASNDHFMHGFLANYSYRRRITDDIDISGGATCDWNRRNLSRTSDDNTRADITGYRLSGFTRSDIQLTGHLNLELGADCDYRKSLEYSNYDVSADTLVADNNMKDKDVYEFSGFCQAMYSRNPIRVSLGSRVTVNELFGTNISSRGTLVLALDENNSLKLIFGQSYRAPSLFELYFETPTQTVFGYEKLEPEKSDSYEIAYLVSINRFFIQALCYYANYYSKIFRFDDPELGAKRYRNGDAFRAGGLELEMKYRNPEFFNIFVNYSYLRGDNGDEFENNDHYNFKYIPQHSVSTGISKCCKRCFVSLISNYNGETEGVFEKIKAQYTLDFNFGFTHGISAGSIRHTLSVKNVFDGDVLIPEYVRRELNEIPFGYGRTIVYSMHMRL